jgi:hypothetical protein
MSLATKALELRGWASGLNFYKLGLYVVLFLAYTGGIYGWATYNCKLDQAHEETKKVETKLVEVVKEVEVRVPVVQYREVASAKQKAEIERLKRKLDEAINNRPDNPTCDLSDAEFNSLQELANKTRK